MTEPLPIGREFLAVELRRLESEIGGLRAIMQQRWDTDQRALEHATRTLTARLESMNEFRAQILDERSLYVRIEQFRDQREMQGRSEETTRSRLDRLEREQATLAGKFWAVGVLATGAGALLSVVSSMLAKGGHP